MQAASLAGFGGISDIWNSITHVAGQAASGAEGALKSACGVVAPVLPTAAIAGGMAGLLTAAGCSAVGTQPSAQGTQILQQLLNAQAATGANANANALTQAAQQAALLSALANPSPPWYKNWKIMVPVGVGVTALGVTSAVLLSRGGHRRRR